MHDLISRAAAIDALSRCQTYLFDTRDTDRKISLEDAEYVIEKLPSTQPERNKGKWIRRDRQDNKGKPLYGWYQCSECGAFIGSNEANFCSECGADMREDDYEID